ncbi:hypothetical protein ASC75_20205 [Aminobacter sp. DSM 101952]|uniref:hypothetical protein n=1 Tax=Aminobacter sp. DSM 101952 TaxID=2735891 RepID=UPI0006F2D7EB|nr:hypothetical protein [Aminobacter sp. DSM 101952]KQU74700.1 hypothetical protein ASC75_20205 [Aminobacter sp. DSM 101952]
MTGFNYVGSGPYCYANAFAMMFGAASPSVSVIEFAMSSPFGMQLVGGSLPFFDPYGWDPEKGFAAALAALGWTSEASSGGGEAAALARLKAALAQGPVWIGPVEMGHLRHQPGMRGPIEADHFVVVLAIEDGRVLMHDPQGYPYAELPLADFMAAWQAATLIYGTAYSMRTAFRRVAERTELEMLEASLPAARRWLAMTDTGDMPGGSLGNGTAAERLADMIEPGCDDGLRGHLIHFAVRVGARRVNDAATGLERIGRTDAARIAARQARLIGALQHPLVVGDDARAATALRALAPTYDELLAVL